MGRILKDIYTDIEIGSLLGFKGGTCALYFYDLPRFSVDLDFDLLDADDKKEKLVSEKVIKILHKYGQVKDEQIKRFTVFGLLSYGDDDHNIKVEINTRDTALEVRKHYEIKKCLGVSMMVAKKDFMFAGKLAALTLRSQTAMRDIFDIHYFANNNWDIDLEVLKARTGKSVSEHLASCIRLIESIKDNEILGGLGELLEGEKEKAWVRNNLRAETIFHLKNYMSALK